MKFVLEVFFTILHFTLVNTIELDYLRGVPRLDNSSYWDYYFSCKTVGKTLQWEVNGDPLGGFLSGNIGRILFSSRTNFDFIATLLSAKPTSGSQYALDSVLIVSLTRNSSLDVICRNENSFIETNNTESRTNVEDMTITSSVSLQHLLTEDIVREDNLKTSIFVCGVNSELLIWQTDTPYAFFALPNSVGQENQILQQNNLSIKQQALIISQEPYVLVSVLFVVGPLDEYVQCANRKITLQFRIKSSLDDTTTATTTDTTITNYKNTTNDSESRIGVAYIIQITISMCAILVSCVSYMWILYVLYVRIRSRKTPPDIKLKEQCQSRETPPETELKEQCQSRKTPLDIELKKQYQSRKTPPDIELKEQCQSRETPPDIELKEQCQSREIPPEIDLNEQCQSRETPFEIDLKEQYQSRLGYLKITEKDLLKIIMDEYLCPVKIWEFSKFVKYAIEFEEFYNEFELIRTQKPENSSVSIAMKNINKNRLQDDLPYDDSLVKITKVDGVKESDYINASYIDGCMENNAYIAAQVPMPDTIADFWRMIYEHHITTIIMFRERLQWKYKPYWPNHVGDEEYQNGTSLNVICKEEQKVKNYYIRKLEVHNTAKGSESEKPLSVTHYEFLGWPFIGVPYHFSILDFIEDVRKQPNISTPIVVLSTMGGRTGVFITLDAIMKKINEHKEECIIEVFKFVRNMWLKRTRMVRTTKQYIYIYEALDKYIKDTLFQPHENSSFSHELQEQCGDSSHQCSC